MTAAADDLAVRTLPVEQGRCLVCTHDVARHDAIGLRFCSATQSQALSRGCICR